MCICRLSDPKIEEAATSASEGDKYWAKGTGFGSGSLRSGWNIGQVQDRKRQSEMQVELCFKVS